MSTPLVHPAIDRELALSRVGGDTDLLKEIAVLFLGDYPKAFAEVQAAAACSDARGLERAALGLKGSVSLFGAPAAVEAARILEEMGRTKQLADLSRVVQDLELALAALRPEL